MFDNDPIKNKGVISCPRVLHSKACNSEVNSPLWPEMVLVQDFMPVLVVCKFEEDPIKTEGAIMSIFFSSAQGQVTRKSMDGCVQNSNSFELYGCPVYLQV